MIFMGILLISISRVYETVRNLRYYKYEKISCINRHFSCIHGYGQQLQQQQKPCGASDQIRLHEFLTEIPYFCLSVCEKR